ncbi:preprotein translocase subunit SecA [Halarsenatibacter silvermanii]|uniref:Protein translocase subunit SecA n=1 Tax=Halarsenatibacter silvermanii TaxID=321763 RepID=A0A1G9MLV2_9FIRM|nr:preprotein translocase subunit SecA [Halarsenatibacter silvermanii]SDL75262.1 preprotein translocase subunit SecA [Halarsenatibacter silvermanii]
MLSSIFKKLFKSYNEKQLERIKPIVENINDLEPDMQELSDDELRAKTEEFKQRYQEGEDLDDLLPEAFAVVREASQRSTDEGFRHYDVQLMGGIVLHEGKIAEMKTGEGKTLAATLPAYLNALAGSQVHVVTVNDYLARRDSEWMGQIYRFLGLSVGCIQNGMPPKERKEQYECDIVYGTNNEFGFDYLRDNMAYSSDDLVQPGHEFAILDEVDSILIDEARTPLIISGPADDTTEDYRKFNRVIPSLEEGRDYEVDEKNKNVTLTEEGVVRAENLLNIENLYDNSNFKLNHRLNQALRAHTLMKKDRDYIVKDGEVKIVDEFTGRVMEGRRFSEGLHQAIEAKEGVEVRKETQTYAKITLQNFFRKYNKLSGMTGTAKTEEDEFIDIYDMEVVVIPTNEPLIRDAMPDRIFRTEDQKFKAVAEEIEELYEKGQPVLVGTVDVDKSEDLSRRLKKRGVPHNVLNAKNHEREAEIIKDAGKKKNVTIATNMAGRGTDIVLGEGVTDLGGLHVIGTERHESRRIDNQLRGRSGRQGDPGSSQFFISLEDDLLRLFGSDNISGILDKLGLEEGEAIEHKMLDSAIERAQKKVEERHFEARKAVLKYDDVLNKQRKVIYDQRQQILTTDEIEEKLQRMLTRVIDDIIDQYLSEDLHPSDWNVEGLLTKLKFFRLERDWDEETVIERGSEAVREELHEEMDQLLENKKEELGEENFVELARQLALRIIDRKWMSHLDNMQELRQGIGLRAYGQKDPLTEFKFESYELFENMNSSIREDIISSLLRVEVRDKKQADRESKSAQDREDLEYEKKDVIARKNRQQQQKSKAAASSGTSSGKDSSKSEDSGVETVVKPDEPGRNDPCHCGSGKKYKKCCGR